MSRYEVSLWKRDLFWRNPSMQLVTLYYYYYHVIWNEIIPSLLRPLLCTHDFLLSYSSETQRRGCFATAHQLKEISNGICASSRVSQKTFFLMLQIFLDLSCQMVYKYTTKSFKFIDQKTKSRQHFLVLHYNYNGEISQKWDLVITFDWGVLLTQGQRVWTAFCKIFSGTPHLTIFGWKDLAKCSSDTLTLCQ